MDQKKTHFLSIGHQTFILQPVRSSISGPPAFDVLCGGKITSGHIMICSKGFAIDSIYRVSHETSIQEKDKRANEL